MSELLSPGDIISTPKQAEGQYRVRRILESDTSMITYLVEYIDEGRQYSLSQIDDSEMVKSLTQSDFMILKDIKHPNIGQIYDICTDEAPYHLTLEYVEGPSLKELSEQFPWPVERVMELAEPMLDALDYLAEYGVYHCDITPDNIIFSDSGPKLINLGIASLKRDAGVSTGMSFYQAPEIERGEEWHPTADLYSLAVVLFEALTGQLPFIKEDDFPQKDRFVKVEEIAIQSHARSVANILLKALHPYPRRRPQSPGQLLSMLRAAPSFSHALSEGEWVENPFVRDLQAIYRNSRVGNAENRGLDSQFAEKTYVPTYLDEKLLPDILNGEYWLVLLTGNPGDGKTAFLDKIGRYLKDADAEEKEWDSANGWRYVLNGHHFIANFDASESSSGKRANEILDEILEHLSGPQPPQEELRRTVLIAINDGRLRDYFLFNRRYEWLGRQIYLLLEEPDKETDERIVLVDLKGRCLTVPTVDDNFDTSLFERILTRLLADNFWQPCLIGKRTQTPQSYTKGWRHSPATFRGGLEREDKVAKNDEGLPF